MAEEEIIREYICGSYRNRLEIYLCTLHMPVGCVVEAIRMRHLERCCRSHVACHSILSPMLETNMTVCIMRTPNNNVLENTRVSVFCFSEHV